MKYELKTDSDGRVPFLLKAGDDFVKNTFKKDVAEKMIEDATDIRQSDFEEYGICLNDEFYLAGRIIPEKKEKKDREKKCTTPNM